MKILEFLQKNMPWESFPGQARPVVSIWKHPPLLYTIKLVSPEKLQIT